MKVRVFTKSKKHTKPIQTQTQTELGVNAAEGAAKQNDNVKPAVKRKKKTAQSYAIELAVKVGLTAVVIWGLCNYVIGIHINHSNSSYPMIKDGDLCITYRLGELKEGDEIAYNHEGQIKFGRIAAKSDDVGEIKNGCVTVSGYSILEDVVYSTTEEGSIITYPYTVPEDSVFVMNDFRSDVLDSRSFGAVKFSDVEGKVVFIIRRRGI